ncbi:ras-like protein family member 11A [Trichonephila inaurata madagascariensis]|uniref:Ras-like protein family member 11A n=1 Tax=Trichonephila inaurata madagascariensis TaxID=2747483 RepID=A0A8X6M8E0_9ARAC|nr:ras-like protein family member 11A [Trichonephila inaurata madagascariensis]
MSCLYDRAPSDWLKRESRFVARRRSCEIGEGTIEENSNLALTVRFLTKRYIGEYDHQTGEMLAKDHNSAFLEVAASEHVSQVADAFYELCREIHSCRRRSKQSLLDRLKYGGRNSRGDSKKKAEH